MGVVGRLSPGGLAAWVEASCTAQGVAVKVVDPGVVRRVCALLGARATGPQARQRGRGPAAGASEAPDRSDASTVEAASAGDTGGDDGVVEDGGDDGVLAREVEAGPLGW